MESASKDREVVRAYNAAYVAEHRDELLASWASYRSEHKDEASAYRATQRDKIRTQKLAYKEWLHALNSTWTCYTCGGVVELWHHLFPNTKRFTIGDGANYTLDALEDELEKCLPMCRPCHQRLHHTKKGES